MRSENATVSRFSKRVTPAVRHLRQFQVVGCLIAVCVCSPVFLLVTRVCAYLHCVWLFDVIRLTESLPLEYRWNLSPGGATGNCSQNHGTQKGKPFKCLNEASAQHL